jgi:ATP synthase F1 complex assembly factor 1
LDGFLLPSSQGGELNDIVKLELLEQESPAQCATIWETHHADASRGRLGATLGAGAWRAVQALAAKKCGCEAALCACRLADAPPSPLFVLPVPKGPPQSGGFLTLLLQWQLPHLVVTTQAEYLRHGSRSAPHLVVTHYTELLESKGLVLCRGSVTSGELSVAEAAAVLGHAHAFYSSPEKQRVVAAFNRGAPDFKFGDVLTACGISTPPS